MMGALMQLGVSLDVEMIVHLRNSDAADLALHAAPGAGHGEVAEDVVIRRDVELGQGGAQANNSQQQCNNTQHSADKMV